MPRHARLTRTLSGTRRLSGSGRALVVSAENPLHAPSGRASLSALHSSADGRGSVTEVHSDANITAPTVRPSLVPSRDARAAFLAGDRDASRRAHDTARTLRLSSLQVALGPAGILRGIPEGQSSPSPTGTPVATGTAPLMPGGSSPKLLDENVSKALARAPELHVSTTSAYVKSAVFGALDATVTIFAFIASW